MNKTIKYPQYRKYLNNKSFYKIISEIEWEELVVLGNTVTKHHFSVKILPDRNYIYDLTFDYQNHWVKIEEDEYNAIQKKIIG